METKMSFEEGPFLTAAFLCEKLLEEPGGVKSAIRIIDRVTRTVSGPYIIDKMEPFNFEMTLLIRLKSGWARGPFTLKIVFIKPSGESPPPMIHTIHFEGDEDRGVDIAGNIAVTFDFPGIHWFDVLLNEVRLTRIPFRVVYSPQVIQKRSGDLPREGPPTEGG